MLEITICDPENLKGIDCEKDEKKVNSMLDKLSFELYTMTKQADTNSNLPVVLKNGGGIETKMIQTPNLLGVFKVQ